MKQNKITIVIFIIVDFKGRSHYSDNQSPTFDNHFFGVVAGGCQRSATGCRYSVTVA